jgi:ubiquinone/menaquinone biosynthesis C-methylase UbiE
VSDSRPDTSSSQKRAHRDEEHDWHSDAYVSDWIEHDAARNDERLPRLKRMMALAPFPRDAEISVLDVGAGHGIVTEEVLAAFPNARITLQDYSNVMLTRARQRLAHLGGQLRFTQCDLMDPAWIAQVGGPFDLAVSAIAIHNLDDLAAIGAVYRWIFQVLKPGGWFLDYDRFRGDDGVQVHTALLRAAGFAQVQCAWEQSKLAILAASGKAA